MKRYARDGDITVTRFPEVLGSLTGDIGRSTDEASPVRGNRQPREGWKAVLDDRAVAPACRGRGRHGVGAHGPRQRGRDRLGGDDGRRVGGVDGGRAMDSFAALNS